MMMRLASFIMSAVVAGSAGDPSLLANQPASSPSPGLTPSSGCTRVKPSREPRKIVNRVAKLSEKAQSTQTHGGFLLYDAVIDEQGIVRELKLLRPVESKEPWPELDTAWRAAISEWRYEPTVVKGKAMRVCMTLSVLIHVR